MARDIRYMEKLIHANSQFIAGHPTRALDWFPTDTKQLYQKNLNDPERRQLLEKFGWINADISYVHNSHGFRTKEFTQTENFISLGCSFTYGTGLPQGCVWPELLSNMINVPVFNLGMAGTSLDTCYRAAKHYIPLLKPKFVVMLVPEKTRMEIFLEDLVYIHLPSNPDVYKFSNDNWMKYWYTNEKNLDTLMQKNIDAIAWICKQNQADFYLVNDNFMYTDHDFWHTDLARDLQHPGKPFHKALAQVFFEKIQNKNVYE